MILSNQITEQEYRNACESDSGFCIECNDFTREMVEPDAENYKCPECEKETVFGAEQALILEYISIFA
jgi:Zn finger protein HypA/HybF involved in hydrogenase expression